MTMISKTLLLVTAAVATLQAATPVVSNIRASQRANTKLVDIYYDVANVGGQQLTVSLAVSGDDGATFAIAAWHCTGNGYGPSVVPGNNRLIVWDAGADWNGQYSDKVKFSITAADTPADMAYIPAGTFTMGNCMDPGEGDSDELPLHQVYVSGFFMDKYYVTKTKWDTVYTWATSHGYSFDNAGSGKASNHPVQTVNWYDCVKWCNARSEKEGLTPCYYTSAAKSTVYRSGQLTLGNDWVNWAANGYRLPTEAEWEKAARGGVAGHRFPWSDTDTIQHARANYYSLTSYAYDTSPTRGYHPTFATGGYPYTSPVGYFAANGYGLYDMVGNVMAWGWDWYGSSYPSSPVSDPRGPSSSAFRVLRGGLWNVYALCSRCAGRGDGVPGSTYVSVGFRCARGL